MANLNSHQAVYRYIIGLFKDNLETDDDILLFEALQHNDIKHACQAIREAHSGEVIYQHLTLRFGENAEQSVYQYQLSPPIKYCLDLLAFIWHCDSHAFKLKHFIQISSVMLSFLFSSMRYCGHRDSTFCHRSSLIIKSAHPCHSFSSDPP